jgi:hypothetical protein
MPSSRLPIPPLQFPPDFVPVFEFKNSLATPITLGLEMAPQEVELAPGDEVKVFVYDKDRTLPITMELSNGYLQIHPHMSWGNWYVFKNGVDVSGEPYRTPYTQPWLGK